MTSPGTAPDCGWCGGPRSPTLIRGVTVDVCTQCDRVTVTRTGLESIVARPTPGQAHVYDDEPGLGLLLGQAELTGRTGPTDVGNPPTPATVHDSNRVLYMIGGVSFGIGVLMLLMTAYILLRYGPNTDATQPVHADQESRPGEPTTAPSPQPAPVDVVPVSPPVAPEPAPPAPPVTPTPAPKVAPDPAPAPAPRPTTGYAAWVDQGWSAVETDPDTAAEAFQRALGERPADADANYGYGYALLKLGRTDTARPHLCAARQGDQATRRDVLGLLSRHNLSCD